MIKTVLEKRWGPWALTGLMAFWLVLCALFHDIDYDEGQYIGAVALMRTGLPFRDFFYLQTPLHPVLLAPLAWIAQGWLVVALRLANAALLGATLFIIYRAIIAHGGGRYRAWLAVGMMALCEPIIFIGAVARNDATPLLLETAGIALLLRHWLVPRVPLRGSWTFLAAGLLMGLALSTKLQFGIVGLGAGLVMLVQWRRMGLLAIALYLVGGIIGCLPFLWFFLLAPDAFLFGVFEYSMVAPWQWYHLGGHGEFFTLPVFLGRLLRFIGLGPTLVVMIAVVHSRLTTKNLGQLILLLDLLIVAGLIAGIMPQPIYRQYLAPLYPALFIRFGLTELWMPRKRVWQGLFYIFTWAAFAENACSEGGHIFPNALSGKSPPIAVSRDAQWVGRQVPRSSRVAGIAPERYVDSGLVLDQRFSTGPFIFRTLELVTPDEARRWHVVPRGRMNEIFAADPPDLLVAGGYRYQDTTEPHGLDVHVEHWARTHGWRPIVSPSGTLTIYLRPGAPRLTPQP